MPLKELNMGFKPYPSVLKNIPVDNKSAIMNNSKVKEAVSIAESNLNGAGRVVLRPSGTESLIRIYIEGEVGFFIEELCEDIAKVIQSQIKR